MSYDLTTAQHQLEGLLGITGEERSWIMRNNQLPDVRTFWTSYKRALNLPDVDRVSIARKKLNFIRTIMRSSFNLNDPRYKIL